MIDRAKRYSVYNYNPMIIVAKGVNQEYLWEVCNDNNVPTVQTMRFEDIEEIFNKGKAIQAGYLTFAEREEKEIYNELGFDKNILKNSDIDKMILETDAEMLQDVLKITDMYYFDRIRMCLVGLKQAKNGNDDRVYDISMRFMDIINRRYEELLKGKLDSEFLRKSTNVKEDDSVISQLKQEIEDLRKIIVEQKNDKSIASKNDANTDMKEKLPKNTKVKKTLDKK